MNDLTIGQLAKTAGVSVETIRYYQRIGLIDEPAKPVDGYRRYPVEVSERIHFIKRAQKLGFTLAETAELMGLDAMDCDEARQLAEQKQRQIQQRIDDLLSMQDILSQLIRSCRKSGRNTGCGIIESLSQTRPQ